MSNKTKTLCIHNRGYSYCKECKSTYDRVYSTLANEAYKQYISKIGCISCGFNHPNALHVHHLATEFKRYGRSQGQAANIQDLKQNKAIILCANCHDLFHGHFGGKNQPFPLLTQGQTREIIMKERDLK